jgi:hypothetical protein
VSSSVYCHDCGADADTRISLIRCADCDHFYRYGDVEPDRDPRIDGYEPESDPDV